MAIPLSRPQFLSVYSRPDETMQDEMDQGDSKDGRVYAMAFLHNFTTPNHGVESAVQSVGIVSFLCPVPRSQMPDNRSAA